MEEVGQRRDHRDRSRSGRRLGGMDRSKSPRRSHHSPSSTSQSRAIEVPPDHDNQHHRPRDRSRDRNKPHSADKSRSLAPSEDLIPRYREKQARAAGQESRSHHSRARSRSRSRDHGRHHRSPSSPKRHRSRSKSPRRKRSRRDHSPSRGTRDGGSHSTSKRRRRSSDGRKSGSSRRHGDPRPPSDLPESNSRKSRRDSFNGSPPRSTRDSRGSKDSRQPRPRDRHRSRSRSPTSHSHRSHRQTSIRSDTVVAEGSKGTSEREDQSSRPPKGSESGKRDHPLRSSHDDEMISRNIHGGSVSRYNDENGRSRSPPHRTSLSPTRRNSRTELALHHHSEQDSRHAPLAAKSTSRSPPFDPPSGPSNRGQRAGFRGGSFTGRGAHRNPSSWGGQWNSNSSRSYEQRRGSNGDNDGMNAMDIDHKDPAEKAFDSLRNDRGHDRSERPRQDAPKGPSAQTDSPSKFSFAFKLSSKAAPGPNPEISQKFNAPAQKRETQQKGGRNDPPPGAPTQPAALFDRKPPDGPKMAPRMRKVIKKMQRPKPRPTLPPHLVESESVFFRKPGNESVVGSGTYGKVFKGLNVYTKGQVALKRIRMEGERDGFPVTAVREIKLLQSLRHENIVNLQEVMVEKNDCFMVFEYLSHDLTGLLNHPHFKLEPPQKKHLAKQLFEGLDYLHVRGVLHRDIKAANILVSSDGILKIADFGLARFYAKRHQLDYTNRVITIWYRSPELLLGETQYTAAVDIWSAACVMMEIFVQKPIFAGDGTELSQLDKIYNVLGTPNRHDWPGLVDMAWFELLRPTAKRRSMFAEMFSTELTPAAYELMQSMFLYDPVKRPTAEEVLAHPYFTTEEPVPQQATELANIGGDWHEFESKALRKENERREREARRAARIPPTSAAIPASTAIPATATADRAKHTGHGQERKRGTDGDEDARDAKRVHVEESAVA